MAVDRYEDEYGNPANEPDSWFDAQGSDPYYGTDADAFENNPDRARAWLDMVSEKTGASVEESDIGLLLSKDPQDFEATQRALEQQYALRGGVKPATSSRSGTSSGGGGFAAPGLPNRSAFTSPDPLRPWEETFTAPTPEQALNTSGFTFRLGEGLKALERASAAKGTLLTGGTLKGLQNYAQESASQEYGNTYNRAFNEYENRRQSFLTNEANRYNSQRGNLQDQWGIESGYFDMGRANRLDDFAIFQGSDMNNFTKLLEMAKLTRPPSPYAGF